MFTEANPFGNRQKNFRERPQSEAVSMPLQDCVLLLLHVNMYLVMCFGDVLDIKNVCRMKQDLNYNPEGYVCTSVGDRNVYVYQGVPIKSIEFDTFSLKSSLIIFESVDRIVIKRGSMELCNKVDIRNPSRSMVIVNGRICGKVCIVTFFTIYRGLSTSTYCCMLGFVTIHWSLLLLWVVYRPPVVVVSLTQLLFPSLFLVYMYDTMMHMCFTSNQTIPQLCGMFVSVTLVWTMCILFFEFSLDL